MASNEFRDHDNEIDFEDMSLSEREELLKHEARRRYIARKEKQKSRKRKNTLLTVSRILAITLVIFVIVAYVFYNMSSAKKDKRNEGIEAFENGKYEEAVRLFSESIEESQWFTKDMDIDTYFYLGDAYMRLGKFQEAKETYHYIQAFGSKETASLANPYLNISDAMTDVMDGKYDMAIEKLKVEVDNGDSVAAMYLGTCYEMLGDNKKMLESYEIYLKDNPVNSYLAYQISTYYLENDNVELAKAYIDNGLEADEEYKDKLLFNDIVYYEKNHDFETALSKAETLKNDYPDVEEYKKEYDFLYTRVNVDTTLSNQSETTETE